MFFIHAITENHVINCMLKLKFPSGNCKSLDLYITLTLSVRPCNSIHMGIAIRSTGFQSHFITLGFEQGNNISIMVSRSLCPCAPPPPHPLLATSCGHAPVVQLLLSSGASTTVKDADGHTPLNVIAEDTIARLFEAYRNT